MLACISNHPTSAEKQRGFLVLGLHAGSPLGSCLASGCLLELKSGMRLLQFDRRLLF